jgi:hypothetical protein
VVLTPPPVATYKAPTRKAAEPKKVTEKQPASSPANTTSNAPIAAPQPRNQPSVEEKMPVSQQDKPPRQEDPPLVGSTQENEPETDSYAAAMQGQAMPTQTEKAPQVVAESPRSEPGCY